MKVHGYAAKQAKAPLEPYSFERREPGNNDVVIDIQYCGICHTDIHQVNDEWAGSTLTYNGVERDEQTRTQGGYSDKIVVDENYVLRIPDNLQMDRAAPLLCAGITMYSPLRHWNAGPGKRVGIVGLGGLGHMGVKIAHALGAEVSVLSHTLRKE